MVRLVVNALHNAGLGGRTARDGADADGDDLADVKRLRVRTRPLSHGGPDGRRGFISATLPFGGAEKLVDAFGTEREKRINYGGMLNLTRHPVSRRCRASRHARRP